MLLSGVVGHDKARVQFFERPGRRDAAGGQWGSHFVLIKITFGGVKPLPEGAMQRNYDSLGKLALFCAGQARTSTMKEAAREAWRLAVEYRVVR